MKTIHVLALLCLVLAGCGKQPATWQTVQADNGGYTVSMPGKPAETVQTATVSQGTIEMHIQELITPNVNYTAAYTKYPPGFLDQMGGDADQLFDRARDATAQQRKAQVLEDGKGRVAGNPSRSLVMKFYMDENKSEVVMKQVMVLVKGQLFMTQTLVLPQGGESANKDAAQFHESLKIPMP